MTNQDIFAILDRFERGPLQTMKLSTKEFSLELTRAAGVPSPVPAAPAVKEETPPQEETLITAPLVGTFYTAPAPDQPPFVSPGDRVKKGQTVCLLEAMKMMSEVPAPCDCVIEDVLKSNGELVSFGEPLFSFRPC